MYLRPLSLRVEQRRPAVVVDPELVLGSGPLGVQLIRLLSQTMEVWLVPELWQILDNTCHWRDQPELLLPGRPPDLIRDSLNACERWRAETDAAGLGCFYVGHHGSESLLPEGVDHALLGRWQMLAASFERHAQGFPLDRPVAAAWRDAAALSAALPAAPILTLAVDGRTPAMAEALTSWQIASLGVTPHDLMHTRERRIYSELCTMAGAAKLVWAGLPLAVMHLVVPNSVAFPARVADERSVAEDGWAFVGEDPWKQARAFWYRL